MPEKCIKPATPAHNKVFLKDLSKDLKKNSIKPYRANNSQKHHSVMKTEPCPNNAQQKTYSTKVEKAKDAASYIKEVLAILLEVMNTPWAKKARREGSQFIDVAVTNIIATSSYGERLMRIRDRYVDKHKLDPTHCNDELFVNNVLSPYCTRFFKQGLNYINKYIINTGITICTKDSIKNSYQTTFNKGFINLHVDWEVFDEFVKNLTIPNVLEYVRSEEELRIAMSNFKKFVDAAIEKNGSYDKKTVIAYYTARAKYRHNNEVCPFDSIDDFVNAQNKDKKESEQKKKLATDIRKRNNSRLYTEKDDELINEHNKNADEMHKFNNIKTGMRFCNALSSMSSDARHAWHDNTYGNGQNTTVEFDINGSMPTMANALANGGIMRDDSKDIYLYIVEKVMKTIHNRELTQDEINYFYMRIRDGIKVQVLSIMNVVGYKYRAINHSQIANQYFKNKSRNYIMTRRAHNEHSQMTRLFNFFRLNVLNYEDHRTYEKAMYDVIINDICGGIRINCMYFAFENKVNLRLLANCAKRGDKNVSVTYDAYKSSKLSKDEIKSIFCESLKEMYDDCVKNNIPLTDKELKYVVNYTPWVMKNLYVEDDITEASIYNSKKAIYAGKYKDIAVCFDPTKEIYYTMKGSIKELLSQLNYDYDVVITKNTIKLDDVEIIKPLKYSMYGNLLSNIARELHNGAYTPESYSMTVIMKY